VLCYALGSYPVGTGGCFPGDKAALRRESDNSAPCNAEVKNGGDMPPLPTSLHDIVLNYIIKYKGSFTLL
jgi:hypothetical protein